ncbi:type I-E CRISPR-associated protein Cas6/Cse3/CasE [Pseudomarimonas arenosa]|uniref:Type I-E CRISPR-associated protein Cas6/Cse3/CasE n=1 Tax=Pseudomarimonas arenosa TaxID=2774145 RepID=A0AAW3ZJ14_9GAMM|nr:type I-E CRISPR-associated protein Cas6/Cse3/CasE [Pseudomarimonas arenosa]MBD8525976.1 type I-E CRISPR-associated protein Cas6/Cse3/CasE [Pseudomarimonas arenosa]
MYLTRLRLDPRSAQARRDLADPYEMHRTLVRAFVRDEAQTPPRILWRAEPVTTWSEPVVLVQTQVAGDWSALSSIHSYLKGEAEVREWHPERWIQDRERLRFRLFANPNVTRNGKRLGLMSEDAQLAWLARQGERRGFFVEAALATGSELMRSPKGDTRISVLKVCFEGRLQVNDVTKLARATIDGIGPGKAFGCGLLSLARCR